MRVNSNTNLQPVIKASADSKYYLVGLVDENNNLIGLGQGSVTVVDSLVAAKAYLKAHYIFSAMLEFERANDETCGFTKSASNRQRIFL